MKQFLVGLIVGLFLASSSAYAAGVFSNGYLFGWTVEIRGREICATPYIWAGLRTIECD